MTSIQQENGAHVPPIKEYPDKYANQVVVVLELVQESEKQLLGSLHNRELR